MKPKLLLHACCGVCSSLVPEKLIPDFDVTIYYENSNIYPSKEFELRAEAAKIMANNFNLPFILAPQDQKAWYKNIRGFALEPERGIRCTKCINFRLNKTFAYAKDNHFSWIATTLSVSRNKNAEQINELGKSLSKVYNLTFLGRDWKKQDGEKLSQLRAREAGIYRQNYCGCVYSINRNVDA
jgi:epoxyqueuosine reductase